MKIFFISALCFVTFAAFTAPEIMPFFDGKIEPTPVSAKNYITIPISEKNINISFGENPVKSAKYADIILKNRIAGIKNHSPYNVNIIIAQYDDSVFSNTGLDFNAIRNKKDGYEITYYVDGKTVHIYAAGSDNRGVFYAAMSILQLIDRTNETMLCAEITDYPLWQHRFVTDLFMLQPERMANFYGMWKINGVAVQSSSWLEMSPEAKPQFGSFATLGDSLRAYKKFYEESGGLMELMLAPRLYGYNNQNKLDCANEAQIEQFIEWAEFAAAHHMEHLMVRVDDVVPQVDGKYLFTSPEEEAKFTSLGQAHGYFMKRLYNALHSKYPNLVFSFCPGPYTIDSHRATENPARQYLADLAKELPPEVYIVWTGRDVGTPVVKEDECQIYLDLVNNHKTFFWHNPEIVAKTLSVPYNLDFHDNFAKNSDYIFFANSEGTGKARNRPADITYNSILWNPAGYRGLNTYLDLTSKIHPVNRVKYEEMFNMFFAIPQIQDRTERAKQLNTLKQKFEVFAPDLDSAWFNHYFEREYATATAVLPEINVPSGPLSADVDGFLNEEIWKYHAAKFNFSDRDGNTDSSTSGMFYYDSVKEVFYLAFSGNKTESEEVSFTLAFLPLGTRSCFISFNNKGIAKTWFHWVIDWNPEWKIKFTEDEKTFSVEMSIAVDEFKKAILPEETTIKRGDIWNFQVNRNNKTFFAKPNPKDEGDVEMFGKIRF